MRIVVLLLLSCFLLPAQALPPREEGRWPFLGRTDLFSAEAVLDLRSLNEETAGQSGFIRYDASGDFIRGDGRPIRFWAVNAVLERDKPFFARPRWSQVEQTVAGNARFLAKRGVNLVRLHAFLNPNLTKTPNAQITDPNMADIEWIWRSVAAYKKEGIYTMFSPYWAVNMKFSNSWGLPQGDKLNAHGLLFFDETMQHAYKSWLRKLLAEPNSFTGVPLARDPALAIIQLQNEDSLLFWTVNNIPEPYKTDLGTRFYAWVIRKYGSYDAAREAWQNNRVAGDKPDEGILAMHNLWEYSQNRTGGFSRRLADQLEFWVATMRNFNAMMAAFLRDELGCGQLVNATNWKSGDPVRLEDAERYAYMAADVMAVNRYTNGVHNGTNRTWAVVKGDEYTSPSILGNPANFALNIRQPKGRPFMITEANWVPPMAYRSEGPLLVAAYSALTGIDAYFWFSMGTEQWAPPQSANGYLDSIEKWDFASPDVLGAFPGAALLFRGGYLKRGEPVLEEHRSAEDLWMRRTPLVAEVASWDPNRDAGDVAPGSSVKTALPVQAFLAGPVHVVFDSDPARTMSLPRDRYLSQDGAAIWSTTGEVAMNTVARLAVIDAPRAQGAVAFFAEHPEPVTTSALTIRSSNDYGSILALSLDDAPLDDSRRIFMQAVTRARPTGWTDEPADIKLSTGEVVSGRKITSHGRAPWQMWKNDFRIELRNTRLTRIVALDENHVPVAGVPFTRTGSGISFSFPEEALYILLTAE
jgi:hypothetical protein